MSEPAPADRYADARAWQQHPVTAAFASGQAFELDPFQFAGCFALEDGRSVLVAAPTGAGKTVVGEFAVHLAMRTARDRAFYTTPMKALSNQKYRELVAVHGEQNVGLLTGDVTVNPHARVVVMTTEVLRNMLYADSGALADLRHVVMDEVHYLADRFRGAVWEEVIIHLPPRVTLTCLSATVSNAEEFGDWLDAVRGSTEVIVSESRPIPLEQHVLVRGDLLPLFDPGQGSAPSQVNRDLVRLRPLSDAGRSANGRTDGRGGDRGRHRHQNRTARFPARRVPERVDRTDAIRLLERDGLLPAIFFVFSRVGCEQAVRQVRRAGVRLTTSDERQAIRQIVQERTSGLAGEDLDVLGFWEWQDDLERGLAAHHAGLLPAFKEVVEELFQRKLVKIVFATETLSLGINMPARTVVIEKLEKFNGEARVPLTPGEYTQLTGRAGRRGIDVEGHAVICWSDGMDAASVAALASRRTYPLNSSFRPTYNMAVNLIDQFGRDRARRLLESSFAQFQADRAVVSLARQVQEQERSLAGYLEAMACDRGDFAEYSGLRRRLGDMEKQSRRDTPGGRGAHERRTREIQSLRRQLQRHPCHSCPDRETHARWGQRYWRLRQRTDQLRRQIQARTGTVARQFDRVLEVLRALDYVHTDAAGALTLTSAGRTMRRIYGERDLLVAESLRTGLWRGLDAADLAALVCALVYEPRRDEEPGLQRLPRGRFRQALDATQRLWAQLDDLEQEHGLPGSAPVALGLVQAMHSWAAGAALEQVLVEAELAAGDFVRWAKQTIDLLDQLSLVAPAELAATARLARDAVRRGIVAYSTV